MNESIFTISILLNFFFPGLGNIICGQKKVGLIILVASFFLTTFYFVPGFVALFPGGDLKSLLIPSVVLFFVALLFDMALVAISIISLVKFKKQNI